MHAAPHTPLPVSLGGRVTALALPPSLSPRRILGASTSWPLVAHSPLPAPRPPPTTWGLAAPALTAILYFYRTLQQLIFYFFFAFAFCFIGCLAG